MSCAAFSSVRASPCLSGTQSWSEAVGKSAASVAVLYSSDYGFSDRLSQTLARGITKTETAVEMVDVLSVESQVSLTAPASWAVFDSQQCCRIQAAVEVAALLIASRSNQMKPNCMDQSLEASIVFLL